MVKTSLIIYKTWRPGRRRGADSPRLRSRLEPDSVPWPRGGQLDGLLRRPAVVPDLHPEAVAHLSRVAARDGFQYLHLRAGGDARPTASSASSSACTSAPQSKRWSQNTHGVPGCVRM